MEPKQKLNNIQIHNVAQFNALKEEDYDPDNTSFIIYFTDDKYEKLVFHEWIKNLVIEKYKYELDNLPTNLKKLLVFSSLYNVVNLDCLPINLKELSLMEQFISGLNFNLDYLPENLEYLHILGRMKKCNLSNLPNNLDTLKLFLYDTEVNLESLPRNLKTLELDSEYKSPLTNLPDKLEKLSLSSDYEATFTDLPNSLREVVIRNDGSYSEKIKNDVISLLGDGVVFSYE